MNSVFEQLLAELNKPGDSSPQEKHKVDAADNPQQSSYSTTQAPTPAVPSYTTHPTEAPSSYATSYDKKNTTTVLAPAPILVPVPGPQGIPGPPGPPGLPGLPGATPNIRGLKAILLAKVGKLWMFAKTIAVLCVAKFLGNLGLILALVVPLYGLLKKAGVALPVQDGYQQQQPSYDAGPAYPQPSYYGPSYTATNNYVNDLQQTVGVALDAGQAAYEPPAAVHSRRRRHLF